MRKKTTLESSSVTNDVYPVEKLRYSVH